MAKNGSYNSNENPATDAIKNWVMVVLTLIFVGLYAAALFGWLKPVADEKMIMRLEPIIFVIIGYYFGRLPAQRNEKTLKEEISRQTQRADAAQHAKETALQTRDAIEERLKNAKLALNGAISATTAVEAVDRNNRSISDEGLQHSAKVAFRILNS